MSAAPVPDREVPGPMVRLIPPRYRTPRRLPPRARPAATALLGLAIVAGGAAEPAAEPRARGDAAWERRAEGSQGERAAAGPVGEAVAEYGRALEAAPGDIAIRDQLLRALYFQARFATTDGAARRAIYARGRELAEEGIARLAAELGRQETFDPRSPGETAAALTSRPESAALFFWAAAHWGLWAEMSGAFTAARQGVAGKIRDYAATAVLIDERCEGAGGHRILGRLHSEAPRIPLITGWVDRDQAVASLERAVELAPAEPLNRLFLADALLRFRPSRRQEALAMIEAVAAQPPRPGALLQDRSTRADALRILERVSQKGG